MGEQATAEAASAVAVAPPEGGKVLQRKCKCGNHTIFGGQCDSCKKGLGGDNTLQRLALNSNVMNEAPPIVHEVLRSSGQPLDAATRNFFEPRFGRDFSHVPVSSQSKLTVGESNDQYEQEADRLADHVMRAPALRHANQPDAASTLDFSGVRIHTDLRSAEAAQSISALAFTVGHNIFFAPNRYSPATAGGQRLLAHELAHVGQQGQVGASPVIRRTIKVENPGEQTPNIPAPFKGSMNAEIVQSWLEKLCPAGLWEVDKATGEVTSSVQKIFCSPTPVSPTRHFTNSGAPESCGCLCELAASENYMFVHAANYFTSFGETIDVGEAGGGVALPRKNFSDVGVSGKENVDLRGVGDTSSFAVTNPEQTLRTPPWLIFGHEACGHVRKGKTKWPNWKDKHPDESRDAADEYAERLTWVEHAQTPEGDLSTVDVENKMRREHSTPTDSYGIRKSQFGFRNPNQPDDTKAYYGSTYVVGPGENLSKIVNRCGLPADRIQSLIFRMNGDRVYDIDEPVKIGERLLIRAIFWHDVMSGETLETIAKMWSASLGNLKRANPQVAEGEKLKPGLRLLIPFNMNDLK